MNFTQHNNNKGNVSTNINNVSGDNNKTSASSNVPKSSGWASKIWRFVTGFFKKHKP